MEYSRIGTSGLTSSRLVHGCMRIAGDNTSESREKGKRAVSAAIDAGINHFDHADIYGGGKCEELFSEVLKGSPGLREKIIITSKCGIRGDPSRYDFSPDHILKTVDGSLSRLGTDYLDILLLHRPDYLFSAKEVAGAFLELQRSGKVRYFGVSNFKPSQVSLLQKYCPMPLITNQLEINIHNIESLENGGLDQCQELRMSPQAWCPLGGVAYPAWGNTFTEEDEKRIELEFDRQAQKYGVDSWVIALAWLLIHPAGIFPIIGTTTPDRMLESARALELDYSREDWYALFEARNGTSVP
jgi:predicted oxidoreductase